MNPKIVYRPFQMQDYNKLADMIRITWQYDDFYTPSTANLLAKAYLCLCLAYQTFTQVAVVEGKPVGVIMGNDIQKHKCPFKFRLKSMQYGIRLLLTSERRKASKFLRDVDKTDKILLDGCHKDYPGELSFFAVHPDYRGYGIGKALFTSVLNYMRQQQIETFYLFTDTSCNYSFYERQGMRRCNEKKELCPLGRKKKELTFFVYEYINEERNK